MSTKSTVPGITAFSANGKHAMTKKKLLQTPTYAKNYLTPLGEKIFLDRYAWKDGSKKSLDVGDTVIVCVDEKTRQREIAVVESLDRHEMKAVVRLRDDSTKEVAIEHIDKPLETTPEQTMARIARGIAAVEKADKQAEWQEKFEWLLEDWKFVPGGRIWAGAGTDQELTFYNCMPPSQEVLTESGYRPIAEVNVGDMVVTHRNRLRRVLHKFERETEEPIYHIRAEGLSDDVLRLTGEHKIHAIRAVDFIEGRTEPQWIPAAHLMVGDFVSALAVSEMVSAPIAISAGGIADIPTRFQQGGLTWSVITDITTEDYAGWVYDIEVDEDHSFISAGVVVSNCYVVPSPHDSRGGIVKTLQQMMEIMSRGGGVGINVSSLRPRYGYVKGVNGRSSGAVSWGGLYSFVTGLIEQGGSRRGALMLICNDWHPDVMEFINSKREAGKITNANISVGISDAFMDAVKADADWDLVFPDTLHPTYDTEWNGDLEAWQAKGYPVIRHKTVKAKEMWNQIIESAWASAEPGLWFRDRANKNSNSWYFNQLICTNPCGEQPLPSFGICNLGAVNLAKFVKDGAVEWETLGKTVRYATRFLDDVIDATPYFFAENAAQQGKERRVGLGVMGLAEMMIRLGLRYGSDEGNAFLDDLFKFFASQAYIASAENAEEKGAFPAFDTEKYLQSGFMLGMPEEVRQTVREKGARNVTLLTVAPTGTTGTMVSTSTGVEPYYFWSYFRKSRLGVHEEVVDVVQAWRDENPGTDLPDYFVTAMDLSPEDHVKVQAVVQKWIDSSISKTCNVPNHYTVEQTAELYQLMYDLGCKGGTIYRDGSRDEQVLNIKKEEPKAAEPAKEAPKAAAPAPYISPNYTNVGDHKRKRARRLKGATYFVHTPVGKAFVTVNRNGEEEPFEVFANVGKVGSEGAAMSEALGRLISLVLRIPSHITPSERLEMVVDQLGGIGGARSIGFGANRVASLPDALAQVLREDLEAHRQDEAAILLGEADPEPHQLELLAVTAQADLCPECGHASFIRIEGCKKCVSCGHAEC